MGSPTPNILKGRGGMATHTPSFPLKTTLTGSNIPGARFKRFFCVFCGRDASPENHAKTGRAIILRQPLKSHMLVVAHRTQIALIDPQMYSGHAKAPQTS